MGGGLVALQSLLIFIKGTKNFNFQLNAPIMKFLKQLLSYEGLLSKEEGEKNIELTCVIVFVISLPRVF